MESTLFALLSLAGGLTIRAGFAIHSTGMVRSRNSVAALARHLADLCVAVLGFWAIGMAIQFGGKAFFGIEPKLLIGWDSHYSDLAFPWVSGVLVATGIVPGVVAERGRFWPCLWTGLLLSAVVIPVARAWGGGPGFLADMRLIDSIGAATLHWPAAVAATVAAIYVGPRTGKFNRDGSSTAIPGHSVPLAGAGLFILILGFALFSAGSAGGALGSVRALLMSGAAGGMAALIFSQVRYYKPDFHLIAAGVIGAIVAASAGGAALCGPAAVLTGAVAGVIIPFAILLLDVRARIDDPSGNIAIHGIGAAWGTVSAPLLATGLSFGDRFRSLGTGLFALALIGLLSAGLSLALWAFLKKATKLRVSEHDEFDGLDLAEHDIGAYPDFQQNTIKSYHLREV